MGGNGGNRHIKVRVVIHVPIVLLTPVTAPNDSRIGPSHNMAPRTTPFFTLASPNANLHDPYEQLTVGEFPPCYYASALHPDPVPQVRARRIRSCRCARSRDESFVRLTAALTFGRYKDLAYLMLDLTILL